MPVAISALPAAANSDPAGILPIVIGGVTYSLNVGSLLTFLAGLGLSQGNPACSISFDGAGNIVLTNSSGAILKIYATGSVSIASSPGLPVIIHGQATAAVVLGTPAANAAEVGVDGDGTPVLRIPQGLDVGFINSVVSPGGPIGWLPVRDMSGTPLGYIPVWI
jgi:hypothetical protein